MKKEYFFENLKDPKHWLGYIFIVLGITFIFYLFHIARYPNEALQTFNLSYLWILLLFVPLIIIDSINHKLKLQ